MNLAVRTLQAELTDEPVETRVRPRVARLALFDSLAAAEPYWTKLVAGRALATPYQGLAWVGAWHQHVSGPAGMTPLIAIGLDTHDSPLFLIPLVCYRRHGLRVATFFGGDHANTNLALWRRDIVDDVQTSDLNAWLSTIASQCGIDLFMLCSQPVSWSGRRNPFALLQRQPADENFSLEFSGRGGEQVLKHCLKSSMRSRLRTKERKLQQLPGYRYKAATTPQEVDRFLDAFLTQKAAHFRAQGIVNVFAEPGIESFLRTACHEGLTEGKPIIELHALECDAEVLTVFGGVGDGRRFSCMFNSYTVSENGRWSPGLIILTHVVAHYADAKYSSFDLGLGYAHYKTFFCEPEPMFNVFVAGSARGTIAVAALRSLSHLKHGIKSNDRLRAALSWLRRITAGASAAPTE